MVVVAARRRALWANGFPLIVAAIGVIVALVVPGDAPSGAWLAPLRVLMTALVPSIDRFAAVSSNPGETRNFLAIAWACVPLMSYLNLRLGVVTYERGEVSANPFAFAFGVVFFAWLALLPIYWFDMTDPSGQPVGTTGVLARLVAHSMFWLGFAGSLVCLVASAAISILYRLLSNNIQFAWQLLRARLRSSRKK